MTGLLAALVLWSPAAAQTEIRGVPVSVERIRAAGDPLDACQAPSGRRGPRRGRIGLALPDADELRALTPVPFIEESEPALVVEAARRPRSRGAIPERPRRSGEARSPRSGRSSLRPVSADSLPALRDDMPPASAVLGARRTAAYWAAKPASQRVAIGGRSYTAGQLARSLAALADLFESTSDPAELRRQLGERFDIYQSPADGGGAQGKVTGYFAPDIPITQTPGRQGTPLLRNPGGPVTSSRREIAEGALAGRGLELFWTEHPADLLALQIEGSGWGILPDGRKLLLASSGANTYSFRSVSRALKECGVTPGLLGPIELAAFLKSQPFERQQKMVNLNPRYVFFRTPGEGGPRGAAEIELVPGRSIAVDPRHVPLALPGLLESQQPVAGPEGEIRGTREFARFIFTHDTGDAIRGGARVDLYWGDGAQAEIEASHMMYPGRLFLFVLKG